MKRDVVLCECFARDGLQHEPDFIATEAKLALIERFAALGFERIEATSYSNPKVVPQFADASDAAAARLPRRDGVFYKATCANVRAVERALGDLEPASARTRSACSCRRPSRTRRRNLKRTREEQWQNVAEMAAAARGRFRMVGTISVAFGCPFEGARRSGRGRRRRAALRPSSASTLVALGDTTGVATPKSVRAGVRAHRARDTGG